MTEPVPVAVMDHDTKERLRRAAEAARRRHPGPVGELLHQELLSWMIFGRYLGSSLIIRVADDLLAEQCPPV